MKSLSTTLQSKYTALQFQGREGGHTCVRYFCCILTGHYIPVSALPLWLRFVPWNVLNNVAFLSIFYIPHKQLLQEYPVRSYPLQHCTEPCKRRCYCCDSLSTNSSIKMACTLLRSRRPVCYNLHQAGCDFTPVRERLGWAVCVCVCVCVCCVPEILGILAAPLGAAAWWDEEGQEAVTTQNFNETKRNRYKAEEESENDGR